MIRKKPMLQIFYHLFSHDCDSNEVISLIFFAYLPVPWKSNKDAIFGFVENCLMIQKALLNRPLEILYSFLIEKDCNISLTKVEFYLFFGTFTFKLVY